MTEEQFETHCQLLAEKWIEKLRASFEKKMREALEKVLLEPRK